MDSPRHQADRERFIAFAFAAAELLVEVGADGRIVFAAGAFRQRLGREPDSLVGRQPSEILAPEDRDAFAAAMALLPTRGRLPPSAYALNDSARTPFAVAGLSMPHPCGTSRFCLTFAPLPQGSVHAATKTSPSLLTRAAEQRLREGERARLALIEVAGVPEAEADALRGMLGSGRGGLSFCHDPTAPGAGPDRPAHVRPVEIETLRGVLTRETGGALVARLAPGRYGLLQEPDATPDLAAIARAVEAVLGDQAEVSVNLAAQIDLAPGALSPIQAARALRHGLSVFARLGAEGLKEAGFENGLEGIVSRIAARAGALRLAVAERRFRLEFQPIASLATRQIQHYEALLRPNPEVLRPGEGPQDFITLAETVGLTEELDLAVASLAIASIPALAPGRDLAFNISGLSAQSQSFRARLLALMDRDRRAAARLLVELTESAEIEHQASAALTLSQLRERGVRVCLDDFGAGAAAFRYLRAFPVDYVKVDGSYVVAALTSERDRSFVQAMVDLSQAVGAAVVAEHIETEECAVLMQELGVKFGQGWLFGKAGPL